jgi:hypothetical protein
VPAGQNHRQFPGEIDGIANAGVHALATSRAVYMSGVAQQESAALPEMLRHPVMNTIGGKPVQLLDFHFEVIDRAVAHVLETERIGVVGSLVPDSPYEARPSPRREREYGQEVSLVQVHMQFAVQRRAGRFDVRDIEDLSIGTARKSGGHRLSHD